MPQPQVCAADTQRAEIADGDSARAKARQLLCEVLPEDALHEFLAEGFFHHKGKAGVYRIGEGAQTEIYRNGRLCAAACLQLTIPAPGCDRMLAEYLILKNDEALYWSKANIFPAKHRLFEPLAVLMAILDLALLLKLGLDYLA